MPVGRVLATQQARDAANQGQWRHDWGQDANHLRQIAATLDGLERRAHQAVEDIFKADSASWSAPMGVVPASNTSPPPRTEEKDQGLLGDISGFFGGAWDIAKRFGEGVKDGAVGFVTGLAGLIGRDPATGEWSWSAAGTAWAGMGKFALAVGVGTSPGGMILDQTIGVPGFKRGELGGTLENAGKGLIAYDEWGKDPARAAGMAVFNIAAAVVGTKGAGAALRGAAAWRAAAKEAEAAAAREAAEAAAKKAAEEAAAKESGAGKPPISDSVGAAREERVAELTGGEIPSG